MVMRAGGEEKGKERTAGPEFSRIGACAAKVNGEYRVTPKFVTGAHTTGTND